MKFSIYLSMGLLVVDMVYKYANGISYLNRDQCLLYSLVPRWLFLIYEYFFELLLLVIVAVFAATVLDRYFFKVNKFVPKSSLGTFLYASIIPVCACSVVPLTTSMKDRIPLRAVITFVVAAPLLNPYIIMLSITVLGIHYTLLRILCAFLLACTTGRIVEAVHGRMKKRPDIGRVDTCSSQGCRFNKENIYEETFSVLRTILPYLALAGVLGLVIELFAPNHLLQQIFTEHTLIGTLLVIAVGVPVYFCNGADVLFLQPLIQFSHLPMGTAMAFSLTSTSICVTSLVLFIKFLGKKLTCVLVSSIIMVTLVLSMALHFILR